MKDKLSKTIVINGQNYHLNKEIPRDLKDIHHIISKKLIQVFKVNDPKNKIEIQRRKHVALNRLFLDHQSPHEQLRDMVKIREPVLSEGVRETLYGLLSLPRGIFYKEELVKKKYFNKELFSDEESEFLKEEI